ncbi:MAG TPA: pantoate--beta-alanine ligase [Gemmatimonadaceae bacterium]|nr:pantoate--beta-alanine ligase [Gemmatimonadaceae bacterium]
MKIVRTIAELRSGLAETRRRGKRIGFVPTMGAFHAGHLALMQRARGEADVVVVSLFVNPTQFNDASDLAAYPRTEASDAAQAEAAGADVLFAPSAEEMYPAGHATTVSVAGLGDTLEGAVRGPGHFRGVATVVASLLNIVQPHALYLGQKDAQQVAVVRRMMRDLQIPTVVVVCPTVREADGLAMSSRNVRLGASDRGRALALRHGLDAALELLARGERGAGALCGAGVAAMARDGVSPEYFVAADPETLELLDPVRGDVLFAVAARVGQVRLIDNELVHLG